MADPPMEDMGSGPKRSTPARIVDLTAAFLAPYVPYTTNWVERGQAVEISWAPRGIQAYLSRTPGKLIDWGWASSLAALDEAQEFVLALPLDKRADAMHSFAEVAATWVAHAPPKEAQEVAVLVGRLSARARAYSINPAMTGQEFWDSIPDDAKGLYGAVARACKLDVQVEKRIPTATEPPLVTKQRLDGLLERQFKYAEPPTPSVPTWTTAARHTESPAVDHYAVHVATGATVAQVRQHWYSRLGTSDAPGEFHAVMARHCAVAVAAGTHYNQTGRWVCIDPRCIGDEFCSNCAGALMAHMQATNVMEEHGLLVGTGMREALRRAGLYSKPCPLVAVFYPSIAGPKDYTAAGMAIRMDCVSQEEAEQAKRGRATCGVPAVINPEWARENYSRGEVKDKKIMQLTLTTLYTALGRDPTPWERSCMANNHGYDQWSVAATILLYSQLPASVQVAIDAARWVDVPLVSWKDRFKKWLNAVRRCPSVVGHPDAGPLEWVALRKLGNVTYRSMEEADWPSDVEKRTRATPVHFAIDQSGRLSRQLWRQSMTEESEATAREVVGDSVEQSRMTSRREWWLARHAWVPNGSTSMRYVVDATIKSDIDRVDPAARPTKKAVVEELPDDYADRCAAMYPTVVARASTKPEPGGKARPLYAEDDSPFWNGSYASVHLEKNMSTRGIKARQTPSDVVNWLAASYAPEAERTMRVWYSLDYADYNTEHEGYDLFSFDYALAKQWEQSAARQQVALDKSNSAKWVALSHFNKWATTPLGLKRFPDTLLSGDRNTARDNTGLHKHYAMTCLKSARVYDPKATFRQENYTGDDEDNEHDDWVAAFIYQSAEDLARFQMKAEKQAVDDHEFLQRVLVDGSLPIRPLAASIAQFASGNWYVDKHMWYDSAVSAVSDSIWDMVRRGLDINVGRRLAVETLNAAMRVPLGPDLGWKRLEWWAYRNGWDGVSAVPQHPLWYGTTGENLPVPVIKAKPPAASTATGQAARDYVALKRRELRIPDTIDLEMYEQGCRKEGYASLYVNARAEAHRQFGLTEWPERYSRIVLGNAPPPPRIPEDVLKAIILASPENPRPTTIQDVYGRMGVDAGLVSAVGGLEKLLKFAPPELMQYYEQPTQSWKAPIAMRWEDPAIIAWYGTTGKATDGSNADPLASITRRWPKRVLSATEHVPALVVILAPNAAGKSTWGEGKPHVADMDELVEALSGKIVLRSALVGFGARKATALAGLIAQAVARLGATVVTTQMGIRSTLDVDRVGRGRIRPVVVIPTYATLLERGRQRGWSDATISKRVGRWLMQTMSDIKTTLGMQLADVPATDSFDNVEPDGSLRKAINLHDAIDKLLRSIPNTRSTTL